MGTSRRHSNEERAGGSAAPAEQPADEIDSERGDAVGTQPDGVDEEVDANDLDAFISHAARRGADEAERWFLRSFGPEKTRAVRAAYDRRAQSLRELHDPPSLDGAGGTPWYL